MYQSRATGRGGARTDKECASALPFALGRKVTPDRCTKGDGLTLSAAPASQITALGFWSLVIPAWKPLIPVFSMAQNRRRWEVEEGVSAVAVFSVLPTFGPQLLDGSMRRASGGRTSTPGGGRVALLWEQPDARTAGRLAVRHGFARCWRAYAWLASLDFSGRRAFEWCYPPACPPKAKPRKTHREGTTGATAEPLDSRPDLCLGDPQPELRARQLEAKQGNVRGLRL